MHVTRESSSPIRIQTASISSLTRVILRAQPGAGHDAADNNQLPLTGGPPGTNGQRRQRAVTSVAACFGQSGVVWSIGALPSCVRPHRFGKKDLLPDTQPRAEAPRVPP